MHTLKDLTVVGIHLSRVAIGQGKLATNLNVCLLALTKVQVNMFVAYIIRILPSNIFFSINDNKQKHTWTICQVKKQEHTNTSYQVFSV